MPLLVSTPLSADTHAYVFTPLSAYRCDASIHSAVRHSAVFLSDASVNPRCLPAYTYSKPRPALLTDSALCATRHMAPSENPQGRDGADGGRVRGQNGSADGTVAWAAVAGDDWRGGGGGS
eukprot:454383-Rhodomonas_salina.6